MVFFSLFSAQRLHCSSLHLYCNRSYYPILIIFEPFDEQSLHVYLQHSVVQCAQLIRLLKGETTTTAAHFQHALWQCQITVSCERWTTRGWWKRAGPERIWYTNSMSASHAYLCWSNMDGIRPPILADFKILQSFHIDVQCAWVRVYVNFQHYA